MSNDNDREDRKSRKNFGAKQKHKYISDDEKMIYKAKKAHKIKMREIEEEDDSWKNWKEDYQ
jgi:hypothetical protein